MPSFLQGLADQRGQSLERGTGGERQFSLRPAHDAAGTTQTSACLSECGIVRRQDVATEKAEMDQIEASLGKERGEKTVEFLSEKRDLCKMVALCQGVSHFQQAFVLIDTDALEIGIQPRHCTQPCACSAADFQERASMRQVTCRE